MKKIVYILIPLMLFSLIGCGKIINKLKNPDNKTENDKAIQEDLKNKEKELELKERELALEKERMNLEREKATEESSDQIQNNTEKKGPAINLKDFATLWFGTIKDGTSWEASIIDFDGHNFRGRNTVYWKSTPEGFSTNFTGTVDEVTGEVIMYEDKNAKGSGKFVGTINQKGTRMSGIWTRYSDGVTFKWNLEKMEKGDTGY